MISTFGVMFTANQDKAAAELLASASPAARSASPTGRPMGFIGQLFKTLGKHMPPPAGVKSPALWGTRARIDEMFGRRRPRSRPCRANSCSATARAALDGRVQDLLRTAAEDLRRARPARAGGPARRHHGADRADEPLGRRPMVVPSEYLEVIVIKR